MPIVTRFVAGTVAIAALFTGVPAWAAAADPDEGALDLKSAPVEASEATPKSTKLFVEAALGTAPQRYEAGSRSLRRASLDLFYASKFGDNWRVVFSNRVDHIRPKDPGVDDTLNSLREAYVSWEGDGGNTVVDLGRINLRYGPAYGYNPTDFFRDGALRSITSVNPFSLRENRLGTVALRAQRLWQGGSLALVVSPKLANESSGQAFSLDLGATNNRSRGLLTANQQFSDRVSGQVLLYKEPGLGVQPGASLTALVSNAATAHFEWSHARGPGLADRAWAVQGRATSGNRLAAGLTYTTASKLSLTAEVQYNELALSKSDWDRANIGGPALIFSYLTQAQRLQELASRRAYLLYASQRDAGMKNLDVTAFVRLNADDSSYLSWLELRYRWANLDLALQWQRNSGRTSTEYGLYPDRRIAQLVASYHFQ